LIEVARTLFARIGVENTTMNDIATASKKGRRTLYTYFQNKTAIYHAVVESELNRLYGALEAVVNQKISADAKLLLFVRTRFDTVKQIVVRNGTLRARFFRDIRRVEHARKAFDAKEIEIVQKILDEGVQAGIFAVEDSLAMATILHHALKGLEVPYIRGAVNAQSAAEDAQVAGIVRLLFHGIKK
jgi:AcrR family transcriptional regulator